MSSRKIYRYHVNDEGKKGPCFARDVKDCRFPGNGIEHVDTSKEAEELSGHMLAREHGLFGQKRREKKEASDPFRQPRASDPDHIAGNKSFHTPEVEATREKRVIPENESPNERYPEDPETRYLAAQEHSLRLSRKKRDELIPPGTMREKFDGEKEVETPAGKVKMKFHGGDLHSRSEYAYEDEFSKVSYHYGVIHRDQDLGPAVVLKDSAARFYMKFGLLHRNDGGPAVLTPDSIEYWQNGVRHAVGRPAIVYSNGIMEFWRYGKHERTIYPENDLSEPEAIRLARSRWMSDLESVKVSEEDYRNLV